MKTIYNLLFLLISVTNSFATANDDEISKEKNITKIYNVSSDATLQVSNSFGNINVYLWDENKISIQVNIKVTARNEDDANDRINNIDVDFEATTSKVSATTEIEKRSYNNMNYQINYIIKIPRNGNINLTNKYGNITVEKLNGTSVINNKYGNLNLGTFGNKSNTISITYSSSSSIDFIDKLNLNCQYSEFEIDKVNHLDTNGNYNNFELNNAGIVTVSSNYTKINAKNIQKVTINGNYLTLKLGEIANTVSINSNYSDIRFSASKTDSIAIIGNYTHTKINCDDKFAFNAQVNLKYGMFKDKVGLTYSQKSEKNNSSFYEGYRIAEGKSIINITTNYGSVQFLTNQ